MLLLWLRLLLVPLTPTTCQQLSARAAVPRYLNEMPALYKTLFSHTSFVCIRSQSSPQQAGRAFFEEYVRARSLSLSLIVSAQAHPLISAARLSAVARLAAFGLLGSCGLFGSFVRLAWSLSALSCAFGFRCHRRCCRRCLLRALCHFGI